MNIYSINKAIKISFFSKIKVENALKGPMIGIFENLPKFTLEDEVLIWEIMAHQLKYIFKHLNEKNQRLKSRFRYLSL